MSRVLWLHNLTGIDLNLSDINVRVKAGRTIDIYKYNPRLTEDEVNKSLQNGALGRYTKPNKENKVFCKIVKKPVVKPQHKKQVVQVEKTEMGNAVVVKNSLEHIEDGGFISVDYGFDTSLIKISDGISSKAEVEKKIETHNIQTGQPSQAAPQKTQETFMVAENPPPEQKEGKIEVVGSGKNKSIVMKLDHPQVVNADVLAEVEENPEANTEESSVVRPKIKVGKKPQQ